jgi:hypothetical protein
MYAMDEDLVYIFVTKKSTKRSTKLTHKINMEQLELH